MIELKYQTEDCIQWIKQNEFKSIAIQLDKQSTREGVKLLLTLKQLTSPDVKLQLIVSDSCSPDLLAVKHLGDKQVDCLIKFGETCLAPLPRTIDDLPVLFVFGIDVNQDELDFVVNTIKGTFDTEDVNHGQGTSEKDGNEEDNEGKPDSLIVYSTRYAQLAKETVQQLPCLELGQIQSFSFNWDFTDSHKNMIHQDVNASCSDFGAFRINRDVSQYRKVFYIGSKLNLNLRLLTNLILLDPTKRKAYPRQGQRELTKRIGLIERLKAKQTLSLGFLFTNAFPSCDEYLERIDLIKKKNHAIQKIMLIHSTDECKLGNFRDIDAFILINGCKCTSLIDGLDLHLPVLTFKEYEILCGLKIKYGGVDWNQEEISTQGQEQDDDGGDLTSGPDNQLIQSEILSQDSWYGLSVNPAFQPVSFVQEGMKGIASSYTNEPS